ncbi:MAG: c-type cytochrome biogenesis protein CcmI [Alphaproteobacteria bacterium]
MFWIIAGLMAAGALALVLRTLTARQRGETETGSEEVDVYRAQLAELERDVASGMVPAEDAQASRAEIERRLLQADERRRQAEAAPGSIPAEAARRRMAAVIAVMIVPVAAAFLYLALGHPGGTGTAQAPRQASAVPGGGPGQSAQSAPAMQGEDAPALDALAQRLEKRLKQSPEDARGWGLLGRTRSVLGQYEKAAKAYRKAVALEPGEAELQSGLGEALALSNDGQVTPGALQAFQRAHALDPSDSAARFYLGMADYQQGRLRAALDAWVALEKDAPADAPWLSDLRSQIETLARQLGEDPKKLLSQGSRPASPPESASASAPAAAPGTQAQTPPAGRPGPSAADMSAASEMSPEDRQAMVQGMVSGLEARLEENPDDPQGWRMLARSYRVLGEPEKATEALRRLAELRPEDASAQGEYALSLVQRDRTKGGRLSAETVRALRNLLRLDENNAQALFFLGRAEAERGNREQAETHWRRLVQHAPESEPLRKEAEALLNSGSGGIE